MEIRIGELLEGAKKAEGLVVIIDIFRATSTITSILANGAKQVIPVEHTEQAKRLKREHPEYITFGERRGFKVPGFDFGNVPLKASTLNLKGKTAVITTSAGTRGITNAIRAKEIITGSFLNADAVLKYIKKRKPKVVTFVAMGIAAKERGLEDVLYAEYMKERLEGRKPDFAEYKERAKRAKWGRFLRMIGQHGERDFCLELNKYDVVGKVGKTKTGYVVTAVKP